MDISLCRTTQRNPNKAIWVKALPTAAMLCRCNIYKKTSVETDSPVWLSVSTEVVRFITVCLY